MRLRNRSFRNWKTKKSKPGIVINIRFIYIFVLFISIGCDDIKIEPGTPICIDNKIKEFNKSSLCDDADVEEFVFQEKNVYVLMLEAVVRI